MLIMITSQQTKDELQYEQYLRISRQSQCYTISLTIEVCSFFEYWSDLFNSLKTYSLQGLKTESLIAFLSVIATKYNG